MALRYVIAVLVAVPVLAVFGDHRDTPTGISMLPSWQISFDSCQALIGRLKAAGGQAEMLAPPMKISSPLTAPTSASASSGCSRSSASATTAR